MAWKKAGGQKKPCPVQKAPGQPCLPDLETRAAPSSSVRLKYEELQKNELMVLQSIYGDDFVEHKAGHSAWQKSEPTFEIKIRASSNPELAVTLKVVLLATYPRSPPLLTVKDDGSLRESTRFKVQKFIETEPKLLVREEQEMMDRIIEGVRDIVEDAAQIQAQGGELPSLEQERAAHEAHLAELARVEQELAERKRLEKTKEEERVFSDMLQQELKRRQMKAKESRRRKGNLSPPEHAAREAGDPEEFYSLDVPCKFSDKRGNPVSFQKVTSKALHSEGPATAVYTVMPVVPVKAMRPILVLKQAEINTQDKDSTQFKKQLQTVESHLEALKDLRHRNILEVLGYRIDRTISDADSSAPVVWTVTMLSPYSEKGSLKELMEFVDTININKVKTWTVGLLDGLAFLHTNGLVHQDLHPGNILLCKESTGNIVPKIADAAVQRELHIMCEKVPVMASARTSESAYWFPPEIADQKPPQYTQKTDVWDFGVIFLQMTFGLDVTHRYHSPKALMEGHPLSAPMQELVYKFFVTDSKKRPRVFDLISSEFLATDAPVLDEDESALLPGSFLCQPHSLPKIRRESAANRLTDQPQSRYLQDYQDEVLLGKGGFGEVVRVRGRFDKNFYAIKKIKQRSTETLSSILNEVMLLAKMNHPSVVKYWGAWLEDAPGRPDHSEYSGEEDDGEDDSDDGDSPGSDEVAFEHDKSKGLDFMTSSGNPRYLYDYESDDEVVFGMSDDEQQTPGAQHFDSENACKSQPRLVPRNRSILYISMEYCDKNTLRDLISRSLHTEASEVWRLFRQTLDGLAHIHNLHIIHRDLKPDNIFITVDSQGVHHVKIGDFGLATSGQVSSEKRTSALDTGDMTRSIGTSVYTAPEVRTGGTGSYTTKVDMYSLGLIFFEMSYPLLSGMERAMVLEKLRVSPPSLPPDFQPLEKNHSEIILSLVDHDPGRRPSSSDLLSSGQLPVQMETESIKHALEKINDASTPYFVKNLEIMTSRTNEPAKDYAWDLAPISSAQVDPMREYIVMDKLISIFRRHGAVPGSRKRPAIYPRSSLYGEDVVKVVERGGLVLQLPYDLMLGHARALAKAKDMPVGQRLYCFGYVFRDRQAGNQPVMMAEVDFDIVTTDALDLGLREAETIKVLDEIITAFPSLSPTRMSFQLGHSDLLQFIFDYCGVVSTTSRTAAAEVLSKLGSRNFTWQKARIELRSAGLSVTSVDELQRFDFRDTPKKTLVKLRDLFEGSDIFEKASPTLAHLGEVYEYAVRFGVTTQILIHPLNLVREAFFKGGLAYTCVFERKFKEVFAAGGRYDSLIKDQVPKILNRTEKRHAVGFFLNWESLAYAVPKSSGKAFLKRAAEEESQGLFSTKRCDVLVASLDPSVLRSTGIEILQTLWAHDISAELASDARSPEDLLLKHRDDDHSWIVIIKQDNMLKVKSQGRKDAPDADLPIRDLLNWLRGEIRERDAATRAAGMRAARAGPSEGVGGEGGAGGEHHHHHHHHSGQQQDVRVLVAQTKSKKFNRQAVVEQAQTSAVRLAQSFLEGPIVAIETTDPVMDLVQSTALSDPETWRKVEQTVGGAEKKYVHEIHDMLEGWREEWRAQKGSRHAFIYNFRTSNCAYYDLGA